MTLFDWQLQQLEASINQALALRKSKRPQRSASAKLGHATRKQRGRG
jgi:hypothetical protein